MEDLVLTAEFKKKHQTMSNRLGKYSFGIGDRFARQGAYQLDAFVEAAKAGVDITPVWNKSNREHKSVGSTPDTVRAGADTAVKQLGWTGNYLVDADHINYGIVDGYIPHSDFFTIDVADQIGVAANPEQISAFKAKAADLIGELTMGDITLSIDEEFLTACANKFLNAALETGRIYRHIASQKQDVAIEVSMDEVENPQTPAELLVILKMLSLEGVPVNTIAPKFTGRFNKGVDYVGDLQQFEKEFVEDLYVIRHAVAEFGLPKSLKLSVHTGSDKFSLYPIIRRAIQQHGTGLHLKTAGTTWLEELIGLTEAGGLRVGDGEIHLQGGTDAV